MAILLAGTISLLVAAAVVLVEVVEGEAPLVVAAEAVLAGMVAGLAVGVGLVVAEVIRAIITKDTETTPDTPTAETQEKEGDHTEQRKETDK